MGTIMTAAAWAGLVFCAAVTVSGLRQMARTKGGWREAPMWDAPLVFTSMAFALLAFLGILPPVLGAFLVLAPLLVIAATAAGAWRALAAKGPKAAATRRVLAGIAGHLRDAVWNAREDLRDLGGARRLHAAGVPDSRPGPAVTAQAMNALRSVPSVLRDAGGAPTPAEVDADLAAMGASVPLPWRILADYIADFDPIDQDDLEEHMAGDAAGLLTIADAAGMRAEAALGVRKLHPVFAAALIEIADSLADIAVLYPLAMRRYHDEYGAIEDHHEAGGTLPEDARGWFGGGGQAA